VASLIANVVFAVIVIVSPPTVKESVSISGRNVVNYTVNYFESDFFPAGENPTGSNFLLSFTDFIEVENTFRVDFDIPHEISYTYSVTESLLINHGADTTGSTVYQESHIIAEMNGEFNGERLRLTGSTPDEPGGTHIIRPQPHLEVFNEFVDFHREQLKENPLFPDKSVSFNASILLEFVYTIKDDENTKTITRGVRIPISNEVYSPDYTGDVDFSISPHNENESSPNAFLLPLIWAVANIAVILQTVRYFTHRADKKHYEAMTILKKYSDEIFISETPLDYTGNKIVKATKFVELLKLAVNMNRYVLCYHDDKLAEFSVVVDGYAFCYKVEYKKK